MTAGQDHNMLVEFRSFWKTFEEARSEKFQWVDAGNRGKIACLVSTSASVADATVTWVHSCYHFITHVGPIVVPTHNVLHAVMARIIGGRE